MERSLCHLNQNKNRIYASHYRSSSSSVSSSNSSSTASSTHGSQTKEHAGSLLGSIPTSSAIALAGVSLTAGYAFGNYNKSAPHDPHHHHSHHHKERVLPNGLPRGCCSCDATETIYDNLTETQKNLPSQIAKIVGESNVISGLEEDSTNAIYLKGARLGKGQALAIVTPTTLQDAVKVLQATVDADCVVVPQGANTGLTGGSVPKDGKDQSRPSVVISMRKLDTMFPIDNGEKVVCLAGAGIASLASALPTWGFGDRESHSTLGSTFLNPTTAAGVAFGSGGTQLRKGPAYTDRALFAKVYQNKWGKNVVEVVNTLGIEGIEDSDFPNNSGTALEQLDIYARDVKTGFKRPMAKSSDSEHGKAKASDREYAESVCKTNESSWSRYNADTKGLDCNRSEGKVLILATVHDTFAKPAAKKTFWISFADFETTLAFRKEVCLDNPKDLPISVEYMDRDSFDVIDCSGRVMGNLIKVVGMGSFIGLLWNIKLKIGALPIEGSDLICDKFLYYMNNLTPALLPSRMMENGKKYDHHVAMSVGEFGDEEMQRVLERIEKFQKRNAGKVEVQECSSDAEEMSLTAFRFVAAPAFRTYCVGENIQGFSVDYALPKNGGMPPPLDEDKNKGSYPVPVKRMRYSHFGCNVIHEDLAYEMGVDTHAAMYALKKQVELTTGGKVSSCYH